MKKRILSTLLALSMIAALFGGCGSSDTSSENESTNESTTEESGEITSVTVVTSGSGEPYSLLHDDGSWTGIDAEMWAEIEKRTGWEIEVKQATFDAIWGELDTGRADVAANCWAVKDERCEKYYDTIPYYGDAQCVIVAEGNDDIKVFDDLAGTKVGVQNGQAAQTIIEDMAAEIGFEVVLYEESNVAYRDLLLGRLDAVATTTTSVYNFMNFNDGEFEFLEEDLMANNVAYFIPKTEEGAALRDALNEVIQEMLDDGTVAKIVEKWMYADMTQYINEGYDKDN